MVDLGGPTSGGNRGKKRGLRERWSTMSCVTWGDVVQIILNHSNQDLLNVLNPPGSSIVDKVKLSDCSKVSRCNLKTNVSTNQCHSIEAWCRDVY